MDLEILEINASDVRNKDAINSIVGGAASQMSLFGRQKVILIDEVDGISGTQDRGAIPALLEISQRSSFPMLFTANDRENDKLKPLLKACEIIIIDPLPHEQIIKRLEHIARKERISVAKEELSAISRRSGGDMRAAINDLQTASSGEIVTKESVASLDARNAEEAIQQALLRIFKTTSAEVALPAFDAVDEDVDSLMLWIDENLPREYTRPEDLARGFQALAEADKFFGRIRRWQYYRYYVYIYNLLSAGIAISKKSKYPGMIDYKPTGRILKMWIYNQKNAKRKKLSAHLAPRLHTSARRVREDILPYLRIIAKKDKMLSTICDAYNIDDDTAEWFIK
jgi:replication factor C large subunit